MPHAAPPDIPPERRIELLEAEVERLRRQVRSATGIEHDLPPWFNPDEFKRVLGRTMGMMALVWVLAGPLFLLAAFARPLANAGFGDLLAMQLGPIPVFNLGGAATGTPGIGLGLVAVGGMAVGGLAVGGGAIGIVAIGGGAAGIIAYGGGSVGVIATGGGACGYIAIGGSAVGRYALGQRAHGTAALGLNRQDEDAVTFFRRWIPGLSRAVTMPMEVLPVR